MANLVTVTKEGRLFLKIGAILFSVLFVIYLVIAGGSFIQNVFFPKPLPAPLQAFGKLPHITFPSLGSPGIQFRINTIDGTLPTFPDRVDIYKLTKPEPNLLALDSAQKTLAGENFEENQTKLSETLYQWTQTRTGVTIQYDIVTKNFSITSNYLTNPALATSGLMPAEDVIKQDIKAFLSNISNGLDGIDFEKTKVELLELKNGSLVPAENLGQARYARVTLIQSNVGEIPITYDTPTDSILTFVVSYPNFIFLVVEGQFFNHIIDLENKSDYPIKTSVQAMEDLKSGNAYMINPLNLPDVDITNVELKYYLNKTSSEYLLPVIVFTGINFTGYVEAIAPQALEN